MIVYVTNCSGVSAEGCGVTVEGSSVATPPVADTKASFFFKLISYLAYFYKIVWEF